MSEAPKATRRRALLGAWWALGVLVILYILNTLDRGVLSLVVGPVKADLQISDFQMSLLLGFAFAFFYAICGIPLGWLIDRFPRRLILYCGVTVWSLATIACGMAQNYPQLLLARMMLGAGEATLGPAAHSIIADKFPKEKMATALSIYTAGAVIGTGGSIAVGGLAAAYFMQFEVIHFPVLGELRPWQAVFACIGLPGLVLAFLVFTFREPVRLHKRVEGPAGHLMPFLRRRWKLFGCFIGSFAVLSMMIYGSLAWLPAYMERQFDWHPGQIGATLGIVNILSAGIGTLAGGVAVDRLIARGYKDAHLRVFFTAVLVGTPVGLVGFMVDSPTLFLICIFWLKLMAFSYVGYAAAAVQSVTPPTLRGRMAALYLFSLALIGAGGGPSLIAFFTDFMFRDPDKVGLAIAAAIMVLVPIALFFAWLGMKPMREAVDQQRAEDATAEAALV